MRARPMAGLALVTLAAALGTTAAGGQIPRIVEGPTVRWNVRAAINDTLPDAPTVDLWLEGTRAYSYGQPVRVWYRVSDDAYVIVARVDANGHLTVLSPTGRMRSTQVKGGEEIFVRGRRGAASFYATDRMGGGFVFAIASFEPFDLSRLALRDFDRYVTGLYVGRPNRVYIGDPHRVINRFASLVSYDERTPFDYATDFYNVDAPYFLSSAGFANFCNGFYGEYRRGLQERWDDEIYYGVGSTYESSANCFAFNQLCGGWGFLGGQWGYDALGPLCLQRGGRPTDPGNPVGPTLPPASDTSRVRPWLPDSIRGPTGAPDTVGIIPDRRSSETRGGPDELKRQSTTTEGPRRPIIIAEDPSDKSYAIPGRALRQSPMTFGGGRERDIGDSPRPGRDRITPASEGDKGSGGGDIVWVRPPREVMEGPRSDFGEGALPRAPRSRGDGGRDDLRTDRPTFVSERSPLEMPPRFSPPTRDYGPRFDNPSPTIRNSFDSPRYETPPPRFDAPHYNSGGYSPSVGSPGPTIHTGDQVRAAPTAPPAAPVASPGPPPSPGGAASGEKKPGS